jgi:hypothetical protein
MERIPAIEAILTMLPRRRRSIALPKATQATYVPR